ncbi:MAG: hypothetical protein MUF13_04740 [Akkermansiaceae bacterium]|jgi:hypothetical protein|nr:hypothetical protein [Akkermansiaceae bacterium]
MHDRPKESDWKAFRAMVPELRERYLCARNEELRSILNDSARSPTERFWDVEERTQAIAEILRDCLDGHSRSKMELFIMVMFNHGMMTADDLDAFSSEIREQALRRSTL